MRLPSRSFFVDLILTVLGEVAFAFMFKDYWSWPPGPMTWVGLGVMVLIAFAATAVGKMTRRDKTADRLTGRR